MRYCRTTVRRTGSGKMHQCIKFWNLLCFKDTQESTGEVRDQNGSKCHRDGSKTPALLQQFTQTLCNEHETF